MQISGLNKTLRLCLHHNSDTTVFQTVDSGRHLNMAHLGKTSLPNHLCGNRQKDVKEPQIGKIHYGFQSKNLFRNSQTTKDVLGCVISHWMDRQAFQTQLFE